MSDRLHIEIVTSPERLAAAAAFLAAFGCELAAGHPTRIVRRGETIIGVVQSLAVPLMMTFWDPKASSLEVVRGIDAARHWVEGATPGGAVWCTAHDKGEPFTAEVMERIGFQDTGLRVFVSEQRRGQ